MYAQTSWSDEWAALRRVREETLRLVDGLGQDAFDWSPGPGRWSIGEVLDHLLRAEAFFRRDLGRLGELSRAGRPGRIRHDFRDLDIGLPFVPRALMPALELPLSLATLFVPRPVLDALAGSRLIPARHPTAAEPRRGRPAADLRRELREAIEGTSRLLGQLDGRDASRLTVSHPLLGIRTVPELIRFMAQHERRHQGQVADLRRGLGTHPDAPGSGGDAREAIRAVYRRISEAWGRGDAGGVAANFTPDGDLIDPFGRVARGREAVAALLAGNFRGLFRGSRIAFDPRTIRFPARDLAVADGTWQVTLPPAPGGRDVPPIGGPLTTLFRMVDGAWKVEADRPMLPAPLPAGPSGSGA